MKCPSLAVETFCMGNSSSCRVLGMFSAGQQLDIQNLVKGGNLDGMRWPNFSDYRNWLQKFYEPSGFANGYRTGAIRDQKPHYCSIGCLGSSSTSDGIETQSSRNGQGL